MKTAGVMDAAPPALTLDQAAGLLRGSFGVDGALEPLVSERDQNFRVRVADGAAYVLKVSNAAEDRGVVEMEVAAIEHVARLDPSLPVPVARPTLAGGPIASAEVGGARHLARLLPLLPGRNPRPDEILPATIAEIGTLTGRLSRALRGFFHPAAGRVIEWDQKHLPELARHASLVEGAERRELVEVVLARFGERVVPALPRLRGQVIHNDVTLDNLLVDDAGRVTGIIDFGDMAHTALVLDVPATLQSLVRQREDIFAVAAAFLPAFSEIVPLEPDEADLLGDLLAGRMVQTILISAWRTRQYPDNTYIAGWAEPAWVLLGQLAAVGFDEAGRRLAALAIPGAAPEPPTDELTARRDRALGRALSPLTYRRPLHLVRGEGPWLVDTDGRRYLDAYNNVPVVGHAHPRVAAAIARQAAALNTNTRYLYASVVELAERLAASMPPGLDTVMFVNSGSEANDLAWRLATTVTGNRGGLVSAWAYHGVTAAIADLSPSEWPRGERPAHVETFEAPDTYRGRLETPAAVGAAIGRLRGAGHEPALLMIDALFTSDGIFAPPPKVIRDGVAAARAGGALYVADEVQAGHGRSGDGLWSFPAWEVTPDIVTLGKPMGNGHPVAAVITRADIVDVFAAETEFFSTFGGNPVACAAALAVLDVIEDEGVVANAARIGERLHAGIRELAARHSAIGDVRGRGLLVGVELVAEPASREPAADLAVRVKDAMRERGVLIGTTARAGNVLKVRPPLVIGPDEADLVVTTLDEVLAGLGA